MGFRDPIAARPRHGFLFLPRELSLTARTGQVGTLVRTSGGAATDDHGSSLTLPHSMARWERVDSDADAVRDRAGLRLEVDLLSWPFQPAPAAMAFLFEGIEDSTAATSGAGLVYLGNDAVSGGRLFVSATAGGFYQLTHHNGTSPVTSAMAAAPSAGQRFRLYGTISATGVVQLSQQIASGAWSTAAASGTLALASSWGAGSAKLRLNSVGTASPGEQVALGLVVDLGAPSRDDLLQALQYA